MELIWCDLCQSNYSIACESSLGAIIKKAVGKRISIYDLLLLHKNHISFVDNKESAQIIIDNTPNSFIHINRIDEIMDWIL